MELTDEEEAMLGGRLGEAPRRALEQQIAVGEFFGARDFVPVGSVHLAGDAEAMREAGVRHLEEVVALGATCRVPTTINPRSVDFAHAAALGQETHYVELEHRLVAAFERLGALTLNTCVNYQIVSQARFGEHLAWGDTGTVIWANSFAGARSNFEAGPAALYAAITGRVPRYGYHLPEQRRGTVLVRVWDTPRTASDWGALGCHVGRQVDDYWQVPVFRFESAAVHPSADQLKQLGAALASYGSLAMYHVVGLTPEARTLEEAFAGQPPARGLEVAPGALSQTYDTFVPEKDDVDVVVFGTPQLSLFEFRDLARALAGRRVHPQTRVFLTTSDAVKGVADRLGYTRAVEEAGATVLTGVCYYIMTPRELAARHGYRTLLTDSAKLANIIAGYGYNPIFRPTALCVAAAVRGTLSGLTLDLEGSVVEDGA
ncbi:MAG: aconitase X catalytic domain-containing protein [Chloroflexota bacterium]|nr:aconitase X catalytic domain-containing protein [Chloroflexota bacterium]